MNPAPLQVSAFLEYTSELWERFKASGPGVPTIDLTHGLDLLHQFQVWMDAHALLCPCSCV